MTFITVHCGHIPNWCMLFWNNLRIKIIILVKCYRQIVILVNLFTMLIVTCIYTMKWTATVILLYQQMANDHNCTLQITIQYMILEGLSRKFQYTKRATRVTNCKQWLMPPLIVPSCSNLIAFLLTFVLIGTFTIAKWGTLTFCHWHWSSEPVKLCHMHYFSKKGVQHDDVLVQSVITSSTKFNWLREQLRLYEQIARYPCHISLQF